MVLAVAGFALVATALLLVVHVGSAFEANFVILQNQSAKTGLYLLTLVVIGPLALAAGPRLADALAGGPNGAALPTVAAMLATALLAVFVAARLSASAPWGDGVGVVLVAVLLWAVFSSAVVVRALGRPWGLLAVLTRSARWGWAMSALIAICAVLAFTALRSLSVAALLAGAVLAGAIMVLARWGTGLRIGRWPGGAVDVIFIVMLALAIPNVVIFHTAHGTPSSFALPGIIQFHQDYLLGPTNQLLGGGGLMVNVPVSQYGVGYIYFLAACFHIVPIGYGTYGLLDGIITAVFYIVGFCLLRLSRAPRPLAIITMALAVIALIYHLFYAVGELPQQGPLRFGLPMVAILAAASAARWPQHAGWARIGALLTLGVAAIWSLEMLAYTFIVFVVVSIVEACLVHAERLWRWLAIQIAYGIGVCICAHLILAGATLVATGHLPDWSQYLAYVDALVLGGNKAGGISYGFARWSPDLAVGAASFASCAGVGLLIRRAPALARREAVLMVALGGLSAYAIALLSYSDNRSSTYLLPYVALPTLLAAALWVVLLLRAYPRTSSPARLAGVAMALSVAVVMLGAAWPNVGANFSNAALARAYPGGGLAAALRRLAHPPPIDPRAPQGEALLARYSPAKRALILLPDAPDLGTEILIRSHRANRFSIGDPKADAFVDPSIWTGTLRRQLSRLDLGDRFLTDQAGLRIAVALRNRPPNYPLAHPFGTYNPQTEWILQRLAWRFALARVRTDADGLIVARLARR